MRPEITRWLEQSEEEFDTAKISAKAKKWFAVAFWCQQSVEKSLKAFYIYKKKEATGTTHSLTYLARESKIPIRFNTFLRDLTKEYYMSRYPDASEDTPYKIYTKEDATYYITKAEEILTWIQSQIKE
jgi:HEPN domain-containing protein